LAWHQHDFDLALRYAKEAVEQEHGRENEDPVHLNLLGRIYIEQGNFAEARAVLEECLALVNVRADQLNPGPPLAQLGEVYFFEGRLDEARSMLEKSLTYLNEENAIFRAMATTDLAEVALSEGDFEKAREWLRDAIPHANQHVRRLIVFLCALAGYLVLSGKDTKDAQKAIRFYGAIEKLSVKAGIGFNPFYQDLNQKRIALARTKLSVAEWQRAYEAGSGWERSEAVQQAKIELGL
jgi:tetratricopeptide (TPR) repeat protein